MLSEDISRQLSTTRSTVNMSSCDSMRVTGRGPVAAAACVVVVVVVVAVVAVVVVVVAAAVAVPVLIWLGYP